MTFLARSRVGGRTDADIIGTGTPVVHTEMKTVGVSFR